MKTIFCTVGAALAFFVSSTALLAQGVPQLIHYQGRVAVGGVNFNGTGGFKFALVNAAGTSSYWSNDGTSAAGSQPTGAINLSVNRGLYSVLLGDAALSMDPIPATVFNNNDVRLRIWFNDGTTGFQLLTPDQRIASVGYAMIAANVVDGAITAAKLGNNAITTAKIADDAITGAKIADNTIQGVHIVNESLGSLQLADIIDLGDTNSYGELNIFRAGSTNTPAITLEGLNNQIITYGDDGLIQTRLWGPTFGQLLLYDNIGNDQVVQLNANSDGGGSLFLYTSNNATRASLRATTVGGDLTLNAADGGTGVFVDGDSGGAGLLNVYNTNSAVRASLDGLGSNGGGQLTLNANDGSTTVQIYGDSGGAGQVSLNDDTGGETMRLSAHAFGGRLTAFDENGDLTMLAGSSGAVGGFMQLYKANGSLGMNVDGDNANAGYLALYGTNGVANIILNGNVGGDGRITTQELQITGGSDLSEQFDVSGFREAVQPGMVVCIDPEKPGELMLSSKAYDRTAAGVISGAGGVKPGMLMGQKGTAADGQHPVALTGRVYCYVDAAHGTIQPGDLLTTSNTPGHAMKVTDHDRAQGAIIGKAMSKLESGKGLVLILVSLQ